MHHAALIAHDEPSEKVPLAFAPALADYECERRAKAAGIETEIGNHTFRATGLTAYLKNGGTHERAQQIANHASPRTTKLYDRRSDEISRGRGGDD